MYTGNKNFPGVIEFLINRLPKSERYFSLFGGGLGLETSDYTSAANFICAEKDPKCKMYMTAPGAVIEYSCYKDLIEDNVFNSRDFIFADPPYMFSTRRSGNVYYEHEFDNNDHIEFLNYIGSLDAKVMITHPQNKMYSTALSGWINEEFKYMTRGGMYTDSVYMNYDPSSIELLNYNGLGKDFIERQAIKRQRNNIVNKFKNLSFHKRMALIEQLRINELI